MKRAVFLLFVIVLVLFSSRLAFCLVDINTASESEIESVLGISAADAKKIIDGRPYGSVDDVRHVSGISKSVLDRIRDLITVSASGGANAEPASRRDELDTRDTQKESSDLLRGSSTETKEERDTSRREEREDSGSRERRDDSGSRQRREN